MPSGSGGVWGRWSIFAAATGMRPGEWVALEHRDIDREARVVFVRRCFSKGRLTQPEDRGEPARGAAPGAGARRARPASHWSVRATLLFSAATRRLPRPAQLPQPQLEASPARGGIEPFRRIYDLRHTFATFALRAGISTFELSRYMGASLTMIDRHYGHLARDGREHAIRLLDDLNAPAVDAGGRSVDAGSDAVTPDADNRNALSRQ